MNKEKHLVILMLLVITMAETKTLMLGTKKMNFFLFRRELIKRLSEHYLSRVLELPAQRSEIDIQNSEYQEEKIHLPKRKVSNKNNFIGDLRWFKRISKWISYLLHKELFILLLAKWSHTYHWSFEYYFSFWNKKKILSILVSSLIPVPVIVDQEQQKKNEINANYYHTVNACIEWCFGEVILCILNILYISIVLQQKELLRESFF